MDRRLELHEKLKELCPNVYFAPPESVKMVYPCIVYKLSTYDTIRADNIIHLGKPRYDVTIIDKNPDSLIYAQMLEKFMYCRFDRFYTSANLNHFAMQLYY